MPTTKTGSPRLGALLILALLPLAARGEDAGAPAARAPGAVSYYTQVRPIFQARCQGCHQPAKAGGDYVMTAFDRLVAGGESDMPAVVPHRPEESYLLEQVTPVEGEAAMPQGKDALAGPRST
jgi:mono/diheme cytochrome c family protein